MSRCLPKQQIILQGLTTGYIAQLAVKEEGIAGRCLLATADIKRGMWLCEYKSHHTFPPSTCQEGSYIAQSAYAVPGVGKMCWDATRRYKQLGHYMNHAQQPNAAITPPMWARRKWRIGLVGVRDIQEEDEVVW